MEMAKIGATAKGGCNRQALTDLDMEGRALFRKWCEDAGCSARWDAIGNMFIRRQGNQDGLPVILVGSHLDTQPTGGKFDGVYGVLAGLEVVETLNDHQILTDHPIDIVVWTNEEGARFSPAMVGSGVFGGVFDLGESLNISDKSGITIREALGEYAGSDDNRPPEIKAAFEVHIEQGPILEMEEQTIGVVTGIQGIRWYDLTLHGAPVHAGPTPMEARSDPMRGLTGIVDELYKLAADHGPWARATFGDVTASPGSRNTVPQSVTLAVDLRHPDKQVLASIDQSFREITERVCKDHGLTGEIRDEWNLPPVSFNENCIAAVQTAVDRLGYSNKSMVSGAGHDAGYVANVAPTSMIFIPCEDGISHNEAESAEPSDVEAGCNVLLHAVLEVASHP